MVDMLAAPSDLASWLQQDLDTASATLALTAATGWIQQEVGQRIVYVANDTVTLRAGRPTLQLPELPVVAVGAVVTLDPTGTTTTRTLNVHYNVVGDELRWLSWGTWGNGRLGAGNLGWPLMATVTYSHGYSTIPEGIRGVCLSAAARVYSNPGSMRSETVGGESWTAAGSATDIGPGLTDAERLALAAYRPLVVA